MVKMLLSISIPSYNTKTLLKNCLKSIYKNKCDFNFEVIVVDNASNDGTTNMMRKEFPNVKLIANKKNLYFGKAHNKALRISRGKYVMLLNSDTILPSKCLIKLVSFLEKNPTMGAASCIQVNTKNKIDKTCSAFPNPLVEILEDNMFNKFFSKLNIIKKYRYSDWDRKSTFPVDAVGSSLVILRRKILEKIGFFDENFILFYGEDDICLNIKKLGYSIYHYSGVKITHIGSQSLKSLKKWEIFKISQNDKLYYYKKHFGIFWYVVLRIAFLPNWIYWRLKSLD